MRVYLDLCALKRPYDRPSSDLVVAESLAVLNLIEAFTRGQVEIVSSAALEAENARNPDETRRESVATLLASFAGQLRWADSIEGRARELSAFGFQPLDALHVAMAESALCEYLVTTDTRFLRGMRNHADELKVKGLDPVEALRRLEETEA